MYTYIDFGTKSGNVHNFKILIRLTFKTDNNVHLLLNVTMFLLLIIETCVN